MPGTDSRWAELSSQNERIATAAEPPDLPVSAELVSPSSEVRWAELASQSERLVSTSDPQFRLASSPRGSSVMRLVATV